MKVYTSYYRRMKELVDAGFEPISISRTEPSWVGPIQHFPDLAPTGRLLNDYRKGYVDWDGYRDRYKKETLDSLEPKSVAERIVAMANGKKPALMCWEKKTCHRELVAEWLRAAGVEAEEVEQVEHEEQE